MSSPPICPPTCPPPPQYHPPQLGSSSSSSSCVPDFRSGSDSDSDCDSEKDHQLNLDVPCHSKKRRRARSRLIPSPEALFGIPVLAPIGSGRVHVHGSRSRRRHSDESKVTSTTESTLSGDLLELQEVTSRSRSTSSRSPPVGGLEVMGDYGMNTSDPEFRRLQRVRNRLCREKRGRTDSFPSFSVNTDGGGNESSGIQSLRTSFNTFEGSESASGSFCSRNACLNSIGGSGVMPMTVSSPPPPIRFLQFEKVMFQEKMGRNRSSMGDPFENVPVSEWIGTGEMSGSSEPVSVANSGRKVSAGLNVEVGLSFSNETKKTEKKNETRKRRKQHRRSRNRRNRDAERNSPEMTAPGYSIQTVLLARVVPFCTRCYRRVFPKFSEERIELAYQKSQKWSDVRHWIFLVVFAVCFWWRFVVGCLLGHVLEDLFGWKRGFLLPPTYSVLLESISGGICLLLVSVGVVGLYYSSSGTWISDFTRLLGLFVFTCLLAYAHAVEHPIHLLFAGLAQSFHLVVALPSIRVALGFVVASVLLLPVIPLILRLGYGLSSLLNVSFQTGLVLVVSTIMLWNHRSQDRAVFLMRMRISQVSVALRENIRQFRRCLRMVVPVPFVRLMNQVIEGRNVIAVDLPKIPVLQLRFRGSATPRSCRRFMRFLRDFVSFADRVSKQFGLRPFGAFLNERCWFCREFSRSAITDCVRFALILLRVLQERSFADLEADFYIHVTQGSCFLMLKNGQHSVASVVSRRTRFSMVREPYLIFLDRFCAECYPPEMLEVRGRGNLFVFLPENFPGLLKSVAAYKLPRMDGGEVRDDVTLCEHLLDSSGSEDSSFPSESTGNSRNTEIRDLDTDIPPMRVSVPCGMSMRALLFQKHNASVQPSSFHLPTPVGILVCCHLAAVFLPLCLDRHDTLYILATSLALSFLAVLGLLLLLCVSRSPKMCEVVLLLLKFLCVVSHFFVGATGYVDCLHFSILLLSFELSGFCGSVILGIVLIYAVVGMTCGLYLRSAAQIAACLISPLPFVICSFRFSRGVVVECVGNKKLRKQTSLLSHLVGKKLFCLKNIHRSVLAFRLVESKDFCGGLEVSELRNVWFLFVSLRIDEDVGLREMVSYLNCFHRLVVSSGNGLRARLLHTDSLSYLFVLQSATPNMCETSARCRFSEFISVCRDALLLCHVFETSCGMFPVDPPEISFGIAESSVHTIASESKAITYSNGASLSSQACARSHHNGAVVLSPEVLEFLVKSGARIPLEPAEEGWMCVSLSDPAVRRMLESPTNRNVHW